MLEVNFTLALHKIPPSVITICHKALSLCAAKQHSRFPAKFDAVAHSKADKVVVNREFHCLENHVWVLFLQVLVTMGKHIHHEYIPIK